MTPSAFRVRTLNDRPLDPDGAFVLYWMTTARRTRWNFGLQRAAAIARELRTPIVVLEALRCDYPAASDRLHRFVLDGMTANGAAMRGYLSVNDDVNDVFTRTGQPWASVGAYRHKPNAS